MDPDEPWRDLFRHRLAEVDVPDSRVHEVIAVAGARVRRRRRLRSAAPVVAVTATALAVAGIAGTSRLLAGPAASPATTAVTSPSEPVPTESTIVARLERILSAKGQVSDAAHGTARTGAEGTWLRYDDGRGPVAVAVIIERVPAGTAAGWSCAVPTCAVRTRPDRSVLMTEQSSVESGAYQQWTAKIGRPDGVVITLIACNSDKPKGAVTRSEPPLSIAQLSSIVIDLNR